MITHQHSHQDEHYERRKKTIQPDEKKIIRRLLTNRPGCFLHLKHPQPAHPCPRRWRIIHLVNLRPLQETPCPRPTSPILSHEPLASDSAPPPALQTGSFIVRGKNTHLAAHLLGGLAQRSAWIRPSQAPIPPAPSVAGHLINSMVCLPTKPL